MKLLRVVIFLVLLVGVLCSVSNINLNPTGFYPKISTKGGLYVSITILIYMLFAELGYLPYRYRWQRSIDGVNNKLMNNPYLFGDRNVVLQIIRSLDHHDCLLRYLCELEALRKRAEETGVKVDPQLEENFILLKVAKRKMHPAVLMRENPGSPALPFELAVFTGSEGLETCATTFHLCPYNITTMQSFFGEEISTNLLM